MHDVTGRHLYAVDSVGSLISGGKNILQGWAKVSSDVFLRNKRDAGLLTSEKSEAWHIPLYK